MHHFHPQDRTRTGRTVQNQPGQGKLRNQTAQANVPAEDATAAETPAGSGPPTAAASAEEIETKWHRCHTGKESVHVRYDPNGRFH